MARLRDGGHQAYLVGGAVRDLLLGGHPKDFDVATDATPEAVHALFRNSRIIGRRFRIVHVRFGREIIEVTTFRGHHDNDAPQTAENGGNHSRQSASGLLLRDNVYGTLEEDAVRRDLTVNALYYDSGTFEVFDHVHGLRDLERRSICIIGDPAVRFTEDPVRMLRVMRFAAKLGFRIDRDTARAIPGCAHLLAEIPAARLFDEFLKLFLSGHAAATLELLLQHKLLQYLFPGTAHSLQRDMHTLALVRAAMTNTDQRVAADKPVTPAFLLAALLWPAADRQARHLQEHGEPPIPAMHHAAGQDDRRAHTDPGGGTTMARAAAVCWARKASRRRDSAASSVASMATANSAALAAPACPMAKVATGTPLGICTMLCSESTPCRCRLATGTPSTGTTVLAASMPGRCAAPPAPAMIAFSPRPTAASA